MNVREWINPNSATTLVSLHPSARVSMWAYLWDFCRILADVDIGPEVSIGGGTEIGRGTKIGARSRIGANCFLPSNTIIGEQVFIGPGVTCTDDKVPKVPNTDDPPYIAQPPIIEDFASVGAATILLPGVRIGRGAFVAAGAVVTRDVPAGETWRGFPAREFQPSEDTRGKLTPT